ncbi:MAG TPA: PEP-CTERM sorting domain-containing protein [Candidatus Methylacidiphilales bacterium]
MKFLSNTPTFSLGLVKRLLVVAMLGGTIRHAHAGDQATAQIADTSLGGGEFDYIITLKNTGTTSLETFWFSWVPGEDFMPVSPTNVLSPTNWTDNITHGGPTDGYAIQWLTSSSPTVAPLAPGSSLTFSFESTATPATMAGDSPFYPSTLTGTSFVYSGAPFSDAGAEFEAAVVPEPSALAFLLLGLGGMKLYWAVRSRKSRIRFISTPVC